MILDVGKGRLCIQLRCVCCEASTMYCLPYGLDICSRYMEAARSEVLQVEAFPDCFHLNVLLILQGRTWRKFDILLFMKFSHSKGRMLSIYERSKEYAISQNNI
jgi:hypothetical protein